jgi:hypothetical protein
MKGVCSAGVGPIDMGTQVMSVARVGPAHFCTKHTSVNLLHHEERLEVRKPLIEEGISPP